MVVAVCVRGLRWVRRDNREGLRVYVGWVVYMGAVVWAAWWARRDRRKAMMVLGVLSC